MIPSLLNTAGEPEREARSRRWNAVEALGLASLAFFCAWPLAYGWGVLGGNRWVREAAAAPLYGIMLFAFVVSPWLHRDTAESWGLGNPRRLWRAVREGPAWRRAGLVAVVSALLAGFVWLAFAQWPQVVRALRLPAAALRWPETGPGTVAVLGMGAVLALPLVTCAIRYDNFLPALLTAVKVSAALVAFGLAAAIAQRGWPVVEAFDLRRYAVNVAGYFLWGWFQQLFFCAWFGTRLRKAFGPAPLPRPVLRAAARLRLALVAGLVGAATLGPAGWLWLRSQYGAGPVTPGLLAGLAGFSFPIGAAWGWAYGRDRRRLLVATLSSSFFGLTHIESYGLVLVTWVMGAILAWVFMEDRKRNIAALGLIHGCLGTTFGMLFNGPQAGVLRASYRVGPWNVEQATAAVLIVPVVCLAACVGLTIWSARRLKKA